MMTSIEKIQRNSCVLSQLILLMTPPLKVRNEVKGGITNEAIHQHEKGWHEEIKTRHG